MRISDWSSDVCSSDLLIERRDRLLGERPVGKFEQKVTRHAGLGGGVFEVQACDETFQIGDPILEMIALVRDLAQPGRDQHARVRERQRLGDDLRSEERSVGTSVSVSVDLGGRLNIKKKEEIKQDGRI